MMQVVFVVVTAAVPCLLYRTFFFILFIAQSYSDIGLAECNRVHSSRCCCYRSLTHYADRFDAVRNVSSDDWQLQLF